MKNLICNTCGKVSTVAYDEQGCLSCGDPLAVPVDDYMLDIARGLAYKHYRVIAAQGLLFDGGIAESRLAFESRRPIKEMLNGIKMKQDNWGVKITKSYPLDLERKMLWYIAQIDKTGKATQRLE